MRSCSIVGCNNKYRARGYCWTHRPEPLKPSKCKIENCSNRHEAKGYCLHHYGQYRRKEKLVKPANKEYLKNWMRLSEGRFSALRRAAKDIKIPLDISIEEHTYLLSNPCKYCGGPLNPTGHGLDRVDPTQGYVLLNVVPCCYKCNKIKGDSLTYEEMLIAMKAVLNYRKAGSCGS